MRRIKIPQKISVIINSTTKRYWEDKGYLGKCGTEIEVEEEELLPNSHAIVKRKCDCCGKIYYNTYQRLLRSYRFFNCDYCQDCVKNDSEITKLKKEKTIKTSQDKYGTSSPNQAQIVKRNKEIASLLKYGVDYPTKLEEVKAKSVQTCLKKYGVSHPSKTAEFQERIHQTMRKNGTTPTSKPQLKVFEMLKEQYPDADIEINKAISNLMLDISIIFQNGIKIDIEYDGWYWHQDKRKDFKRDKFIQSQDYKVFRIKSGTLLPTVEQLKNSIDELLLTDKKYSSITLSDWKINK